MEGNKVNINLGCGTSVLPVLFVIFIVAKVIFKYNISWLLVFSPVIAWVVLLLIIVLLWIVLIMLKK